jgi:hypothetical protein
VSGRVRRALLKPWLHALVGVLTLATVSAYNIARAPETYLESALVVLGARNTSLTDNPYSTVGASLITSSAVMTESVMSPQSRARVREAGGTTDFSLALVNYYNQDYPNYSYPFATLTAQSTDPAAAHRTFLAVLRVLRRLLAERQAGVSPRGRLSIQVVGDTGPVAQPGSLKRSLAALGLLAAIAVGMLAKFLDRHEDRLAVLPRQLISRLAGRGVGGHLRSRSQ